MGDLIVVLLPEILGLIVTPAAIAGCVLLLQSRSPLRNAFSFGGAFLLVYAQLAVAALLGGATEPTATSQTVSHWVGLVIGFAFLAIGATIWIRHGAVASGAPKWMQQLEAATPRTAFVAGLALAIVDPNLVIMMAGMSAIASAQTSVAVALAGTVVLLVAAALDFIVPIGAYRLLGERVRSGLDTAKRWMIEHDRALSIGVFLGFGALFTVRGLTALF